MPAPLDQPERANYKKHNIFNSLSVQHNFCSPEGSPHNPPAPSGARHSPFSLRWHGQEGGSNRVADRKEEVQKMHFFRWSPQGMRLLALQTTLLSIVGANVATAATYYVGKGGSNSNSCWQAQSRSTPKLTINDGLSCLKAGDTLYVQAGTYGEEFKNPPGGTSWEKAVRIAAYANDTVTLRPGAGAERIFTFASANSQYVIVDGFIMDAQNVTYEAIKITSSSWQGQSHYIRVENSEIKNAPQSGLLVNGTGHEFVNLDIHRNGSDHLSHGIYLRSSDSLIEGCIVHENSGVGIHVYSQSKGIDNNLILNNQVWGNGINDTRRSVGIILASGSGNKALNNNVWGNGTGIRVDYGASNSEVSHNIIHHNDRYCMIIGSGATKTTLKGNSCFTNWYGILNTGLNTLLLN
jgi:parallel beta-helix repeat protein